MKNDQSKPDTKPLWGLKKTPLTHKPKEERILDTVNRVISRIQNDERNCLWPNIHIRPAWGCRWPSRKTWPPSVTDTRLTSQTSWGVPSGSSSRASNRTRIRPHGICSSEGILGHPSDTTRSGDLSDTMLRGLFGFIHKGKNKGVRPHHRPHLNLRSNGIFTWPMGVLYGEIQRKFPSDKFSVRLSLWNP